jgi:hypothetical protein
MIKFIERGTFIDNEKQRLQGISVYRQVGSGFSYSGTLWMMAEEWEQLKGVIEVGAECNPVGFEYEVEQAERVG